VRNDIAHTGMQSDARKAAEVQKEIEAVYGKLQALLPQGKVRSKNEDLNVPVEQQQ
jgi:hypothetical protein